MAMNQQQFNAIPNTPQGGGFMDWLVGGQGQNISNLTPQQQQVQNQQLQQGQQNSNFGDIESAARRNFQTNTIPSLAERFTAFGNGAQRSSAFQGALGSAGANLESQLGALRSQYGQQQLQTGLNPHLNYVPGSEGFLQQILPQLIDLAAAYASGGSVPGIGATAAAGKKKEEKKEMTPQSASGQARGNYPGTNTSMQQTLNKNLGQYATGRLGGIGETSQQRQPFSLPGSQVMQQPSAMGNASFNPISNFGAFSNPNQSGGGFQNLIGKYLPFGGF